MKSSLACVETNFSWPWLCLCGPSRRVVDLSGVVPNKCKKDNESQKHVEETAHKTGSPVYNPDDTLTGRSEWKLPARQNFGTKRHNQGKPMQ